MFSKYKEFRRERALDRWVVKMQPDYRKAWEMVDDADNDDGSWCNEDNYGHKHLIG
jgi:hypothetical protein